VERNLVADESFGAGARWHRVHRRLYAVAGGAFLVVLGLALWLGFIPDVDLGAGSGLGDGAQVLVLRIPTLALGFRDGASPMALALARVCFAFELVAMTAAAVSGAVWLRADRLRKPLKPAPSGRHLG
jgi:hypothetical protein